MRKWLFILLVLTPITLVAQKEISLKKKYFGGYKGEIPAYRMDTGDEVVDVGETPIEILLAEDVIAITIGNNEIHGTYEVMFEAKTYYLLDATMEGQLATERIMVYKRGRKLSRDGLFPQPVASLKHYKK